MEALVTTDQANDNASINIWNPSSGTKLLSIRGPSAVSSTLCNIADEGFAIVESGKPFVHIWQSGHPLQTSRRILCPGKPCAAAIHPDGSYFAIAIEEKISIWQVGSGRIVTNITSAHFRPVSTIKFSSNGSYLVSGGQEGMINAWNFLQVVSKSSIAPKYTWSDHSLPITGIHVGSGGQKANIYTSSQDRTCKIYSLASGAVLLSISFPSSLTGVIVDAAEHSIFLGSKSGVIYQANLRSPPRSVEQHVIADAEADFLFRKHTCEVTALAISADGRTLVSGDEEGNIFMWDVSSKQSVRTIQQAPSSSSASSSSATQVNTDGSKNSSISRKVTNISFWLGNPENLKGERKPRISFPEVPKLVESQEEDNDNLVIRIWNRHKQDELHERSRSQNFGGNSSKLAMISKLKVELAKNELINRRLQEFCTENILGRREQDAPPNGLKKRKRDSTATI